MDVQTLKVPRPQGSLDRCTDYMDKLLSDLVSNNQIKEVKMCTSKNWEYFDRKAAEFADKGYKLLGSGWIGGEYFQGVWWRE